MKNFINNIFNAISDNLISGGAYYLIAKAAVVTVLIVIVAWVVAAAAGIGLSYFVCYEKKAVSRIGRAVSFIFRSIPVLLLVWLIHYCIFKGSGTITGIITVGLSIGLFGAGNLAEIISDSVLKKQSRMSGDIKGKLEKYYFRMVVPQALEDSLPQLKRLAIHLLQWTTIAGYISVNDLTEVMYGIGHRTMYPFFSIAFTAILYMLAAILVEWIFKFIGKKLKDTVDKK